MKQPSLYSDSAIERRAAKIVAYAQNRYAAPSNDDIEIDENNIKLNRGDRGTWVQAWLWVPDDEL